MTRRKTLAWSVGLIVIGVAPVAADHHAPGSLRMRAKQSAGSAWSPMRWVQRIGQITPAGGQPASAPDPTSDTDPASPDDDPPAQSNPPAPNGGPPAAAEQEAETQAITVTGTRIHREEVDSPSPISVIDRDMLIDAGITNAGDVLQKIPAQGNAVNAQNNDGAGSTRVNLRSLGTARTLVLLNGRRVVPSGLGANSSVDLGTLPLAMIERVEVLKDGASAIYGSGAIAGVVNVITRSNRNGTEANLYTSTSNQADGTNYDLSFVTGQSSDRGNITFSGGYQNQKPVMAGDRDFSRQTYVYDYTCTAERQAAGNCVQALLAGSSASPTGRINTNPNGGPALNIPGCTLRYCTANGQGGFRNFISPSSANLGDAYNVQTLSYLVTPSSRVNLFSSGHYDITRNVHGFFEGQLNRRKSTQQFAEEAVSTSLIGTPISKDSIYNNQLGQDVVDYNRRLVELGPRTFHQEVDTTRLVVGLNGSIDEQVPVLKNWTWEGSFNYGRSDSTQATHGSLIRSHLRNALGPSFRDTQGAHCGTPGNVIDGCVPLDLLHPGSDAITQDAKNYLTFTGTQSGFNEQHTAQLTASGKLIDLPNHAGLSLAIGGDYRLERGGLQPDPLTATGDTTGNAFQPTLGSYHTFEGFGELSLVPIANGEILKWIEINAAARVYDYNTFGSGTTGKVSGLVRTLGGVAVRGSYGTAFRAPNISELFSGLADRFLLVEDPCDTTPPSVKGGVTLSPTLDQRCQATGTPPGGVAVGTSLQRAKLGGNPALQPEKGTVSTVGVVYEPARGLDLTLDYWHIDITNAITNLPVQTILSQCYQAGNNNFCNQIQRDPVTHRISQIIDLNQNVGGVTTSGLDFSAAYQYRNAFGTFRHALEGTYLFQYNVDIGTKDPTTRQEQIVHGRGFYDLGVLPDLKFNVFTTWIHPSGFGAGFNVRFIDSFQECDNDNCNDPTNPRREVSNYATGDLFVTYSRNTRQGTTSITAGMNNVVDAQPPTLYNGPALNADESAYDFLGRQFYLRLSQRF